jgi:hypothetical protein
MEESSYSSLAPAESACHHMRRSIRSQPSPFDCFYPENRETVAFLSPSSRRPSEITCKLRGSRARRSRLAMRDFATNASRMTASSLVSRRIYSFPSGAAAGVPAPRWRLIDPSIDFQIMSTAIRVKIEPAIRA